MGQTKQVEGKPEKAESAGRAEDNAETASRVQEARKLKEEKWGIIIEKDGEDKAR